MLYKVWSVSELKEEWSASSPRFWDMYSHNDSVAVLQRVP